MKLTSKCIIFCEEVSSKETLAALEKHKICTITDNRIRIEYDPKNKIETESFRQVVSLIPNSRILSAILKM